MQQRKAKKIISDLQETYNSIADEFDDSRQYNWQEFDFFKPYLNKDFKVVDLGCGNGRLLKFLNDEFLDYVGIDNSENLLKKAHKNYPKNKFIYGDQVQIPVEDATVDALFNIAAFHHVPSSELQLKALKEMRRILKKDGVLILTVWNLWQKKYWLQLLKAFLRSLVSSYRFNDTFIPWGKKGMRYYHAFLTPELRRLLKDSGFEILEMFTAKNGKKVNLEKGFAFLKGYNICIVVRKGFN